MSENEQQDEQQRVSKREFIAKVSTRSELPVRTVNRVYEAALAELMETVTRGDQLMLTGFGKFYGQAHKGHRVQFAKGGETQIDDYFVLKFSATRAVNKALAQGPVDPDTVSASPAGHQDAMSWQDQDDEDDEDDQAGGQDDIDDRAEQDALFESEAKSRKKAQPKPRTKSASKTAAPKVSASLAAAATQSGRVLKRGKRATGQGATSDRAI